MEGIPAAPELVNRVPLRGPASQEWLPATQVPGGKCQHWVTTFSRQMAAPGVVGTDIEAGRARPQLRTGEIRAHGRQEHPCASYHPLHGPSIISRNPRASALKEGEVGLHFTE